ncbi:unnamed protein product, partial [Effrenium voratum]
QEPLPTASRPAWPEDTQSPSEASKPAAQWPGLQELQSSEASRSAVRWPDAQGQERQSRVDSSSLQWPGTQESTSSGALTPGMQRSDTQERQSSEAARPTAQWPGSPGSQELPSPSEASRPAEQWPDTQERQSPSDASRLQRPGLQGSTSPGMQWSDMQEGTSQAKPQDPRRNGRGRRARRSCRHPAKHPDQLSSGQTRRSASRPAMPQNCSGPAHRSSLRQVAKPRDHRRSGNGPTHR